MKKLILMSVLTAFAAAATFAPLSSAYAAGSKNQGGGPGNSGPGDKNPPGNDPGGKPPGIPGKGK